MYYVNKIVGWALSPLGMLFLGLAFGCVLRRFRTLSRLVVALSLVQIWFFSTGLATRLVGLPLEGREVESSVASLPDADAVVLLGGGMGVHSRCGRAEIFAGADRVWTAAKVFKAGKAPLLTVSGGGAPGELAFLADMGVDTNRVAVLASARNTEEEARMIREKAGRRILLVTSAWHMPRAQMLFERQGFAVTPVPTDYEMNFTAEESLRFGDFFPSSEALMRNSAAVKEWVARFCYALKGSRR